MQEILKDLLQEHFRIFSTTQSHQKQGSRSIGHISVRGKSDLHKFGYHTTAVWHPGVSNVLWNIEIGPLCFKSYSISKVNTILAPPVYRQGRITGWMESNDTDLFFWITAKNAPIRLKFGTFVKNKSRIFFKKELLNYWPRSCLPIIDIIPIDNSRHPAITKHAIEIWSSLFWRKPTLTIFRLSAIAGYFLITFSAT